MFLQFSTENFLSFKDKVTFSMVAGPVSEHEDTHVFGQGKFRLLKSAVLYGANAGGKSNLFAAMSCMKRLVIHSSKDSQAGEELEVEPFRLSTETEHKPSLFEMVFIQNQVLYRYGFVVDKERVHEEWLFYRPDLSKNREVMLFVRENDDISVRPRTPFYEEAKGMERKTRSNALFISVVANFNGPIATSLLEWMREFNFLSGTSNNSMGYTLKLMENLQYRSQILSFVQAADFAIDELKMEKLQVDELRLPTGMEIPKELMEQLSSAEMFVSAHTKFDGNHQPVGHSIFDVNASESEGTKKFLSMAGPILEKLTEGGVLVVDEFDAKLHPLLTRKIIEMFHSYDVNTKNAQLIFATHDVTNLTKELLRRDQVWFAEKDRYGATDLYSLVDYKLDEEETQERKDRKVRKDASYGKDYMLGKYGGIPRIGDLHRFLEEY
ncbi:ATP-binding protein [Paenibacillus athensensis]|uniref:ATPase AAA-type core domain-containing protein n=1 Tax=Paenibacillus athensensis TaxID=1967502 RepID=A0A4Y8Q5F3_9BACL|nr:ATP-binding protein [Paenibacillus athensensis]MCD1259605.1 ATP-binding protein [Paenibacillus athensensis]